MAFSWWEPVYSLYQHIQALLREVLRGHRTSTLWVGEQGTAVDLALSVQQTDRSLLLTMQLPAQVSPSDLEIEIGWETLLVQGCCWQPIGTLKDTDTYPGWFQSLIPLPCPIHPEVAKAEWQDNRLTLTLLKLNQASWKRIKLNLNDRDWNSQEIDQQTALAGVDYSEPYQQVSDLY